MLLHKTRDGAYVVLESASKDTSHLQVIAADGHGGDSGVHTLNIVITPTGSTPPVGSGSDGGGWRGADR